MCRQKDDSVGQLLKKQLATAHVPNKDSERASDADIGRKEAGFGPIVLASNHLRGRLGSAHLDPPELNIKEKQVTAHVPAKQHCSTDVQSSSDEVLAEKSATTLWLKLESICMSKDLTQGSSSKAETLQVRGRTENRNNNYNNYNRDKNMTD
nr:uncharacterized protein LOC127346590 [Lolium perenne]